MSTSPYPLPPGCIFREDFRNPTLAAQNGLVITGNPWRARGVLVSAGHLIMVPRLDTRKGSTLTIIADIDVTAFTGSYRAIVLLQEVYFGLDNSATRMFALTSGFAYSNALTPGPALLGASFSGSSVAFYVNGVPAGTAASTLLTSSANKCSIGSINTINSQQLGQVIRSVRIYNYALSADEIAQDYRTIRGLSA